MALNWQAPTGGNFDDTFYAFLKVMEGNTLAPVPVNGNPTIGVGFDLVAGEKSVQDSVLEGLGLKKSIVEASAAQIDDYTPGSWQAIEYGYITQLRTLMVKGGSITAMHQVMQDRAVNPDQQFADNVPDRRSNFAFVDDTEVRTVYINPTLRSETIKFCNNNMLSATNLPLWHYFFCFGSYRRLYRLTRPAFDSKRRIYFLLLRLGASAFSHMNGFVVFA
jgi:hypothetical protein